MSRAAHDPLAMEAAATRVLLGGVADQWPAPQPLQGELPPVEAFEPELLPVSLRPLAEDVAERMQVPLDFVGALWVLCLAGAVNRRATIQPKAIDRHLMDRGAESMGRSCGGIRPQEIAHSEGPEPAARNYSGGLVPGVRRRA